ncbi:MAG: Gfo/Idh/MocA family oxidoreductase [Lentisphaeria bacterium]|nr:Gfo/Idh/MocA family oxidoreductase [Lentisphaeria bacterium]
MATARVRVAFVGVGGMGQCAHLRNYAALREQCELVALAELRRDLGQTVASRYGIGRVYGAHEELLAAGGFDALVASQPFTRHGVLVPDLLRAHVPVFTEKPLAASIEVGRRLVGCVAGSGTFLMVGYHKRSDPAAIYALERIRAFQATGEIGVLTYVRILMPAGDWIAGGFNELLPGHAPGPALQWDAPATDMDEATNREYIAFVNYYIHQVNFLRHVLGEDYAVRFVDPTGRVLVAQSDSGIPCIIEMSPYSTTVDWQEEVLVAFEHGYVRIRLPAPLACHRAGSVEILRDPGKGVTPVVEAPHLPWVHAMRQQAANFLAAVRGETPPTCDAATALKDLETAREVIRLRFGR